jgi:hypothetical protein
MTIVVGDRVEVRSPDPEYGLGCILAGYDAAYLVQRVEGKNLYLETRLLSLQDPVLATVDEVVKVDRKPWWEESRG